MPPYINRNRIPTVSATTPTPTPTGQVVGSGTLTRLPVTTPAQTLFALPSGITPGLVLVENGGVCEENVDYVVTGQTLTWVSMVTLDVGDDLYIIS